MNHNNRQSDLSRLLGGNSQSHQHEGECNCGGYHPTAEESHAKFNAMYGSQEQFVNNHMEKFAAPFVEPMLDMAVKIAKKQEEDNVEDDRVVSSLIMSYAGSDIGNTLLLSMLEQLSSNMPLGVLKISHTGQNLLDALPEPDTLEESIQNMLALNMVLLQKYAEVVASINVRKALTKEHQG